MPILYARAWGARVAVECPDRPSAQAATQVVPDLWRTRALSKLDGRLVVCPHPQGYRVYQDQDLLGDAADRDALEELLEFGLHQILAARAPQVVFMHSGAVAFQGRVVLFPGLSGSGKSTLTLALQQAGGEVYSDDHAVLDRQARVHAWPLRGRGLVSLTPPAQPLPVGLVLITRFQAGGRFAPRPLEPAQAALQLVPHTQPMHLRPRQCLTTIRRLVSQSLILRSPRGEAQEAARRIQELMCG